MTRELRRDVMLPLVVLMTILILTSAGTVALLARMAPAIERIIGENISSLEAVEQMLLAISQGAADQSTRERFAIALARAEGNVSEESEREPLVVLRSSGPRALAGDVEARRAAIDALATLGAVNRTAVMRSDEEAKRLGYAGSWAAVFLGALSFAWALPALRRARRRIIDPIQEVGSVLDAAHTGDQFRRCRHMPVPLEIEKIMAGIDDLLDARALRGFAEQPSLRAVADRQILLYLLEQRPGPAWVVTPEGSMDTANRAGLELLARDDAPVLRKRLAAAARGEPTSDLRIQPIGGGDRFLCEEAPAAAVEQPV